MVRLFKRKVQLIIGKLNQPNAVLLEGLRVSFEIEMTDGKETNTASLEIFNLSKESLGLLEQNDVSIILKIGYDDEEFTTLFIGNVVEYEYDYDDVDLVVKVKLKDGYIPLTQKRLALSFASNSNSKQIINRIAGELNLTKGDYSTIPNINYAQGFSFVGSPSNALDIVLARIGYEWTIANNVLIITKQNETNSKTVVQYLSPETGLLNSPKRFKSEQTKETKARKTSCRDNKLINGWNIECLIIAGLVPKSLIKVKSAEVEGVFLIKNVRFNGDTEYGDWKATIEAIQQG